MRIRAGFFFGITLANKMKEIQKSPVKAGKQADAMDSEDSE